MNYLNYTTQTFSRKTANGKSKHCRIFDYAKLTNKLIRANEIGKESEVLQTVISCTPGLVQSILNDSVKITNHAGRGNDILKRLKTIDKTNYLSTEEYLAKVTHMKPILWGCARGNKAIIQIKEYFNEHYIYIDHAYMARGHERANYRICVNSRLAGYPKEVCWDRKKYFEDRDVKKGLKPWRKDGEHILLLPSSRNELLTRGKPSWIEETASEIMQYSDRKIVIKEKDDDKDELLKNAWAAVTQGSNAAVDVLRAGIPLFTKEQEVFSYAGNVGFENIESPKMGDREFLFNWLGYNQFTLEEMLTGNAMEILRDIYG